MAPDLPERLLGISIDEAGDRRSTKRVEDDEEELVRFVFVSVGEQRLAIPVNDVRSITEPPAELTRVPRGPRAVEGLTDLRGEITALIDLRIHFPVEQEPAARQRVVVFDRAADEQSAAIRVDEVLGVEAVPESNVLGPDEVERDDLAGGALNHPLVSAIIEQERQQTGDRERSARSETRTVARATGESSNQSFSLLSESSSEDEGDAESVLASEFTLESEEEDERAESNDADEHQEPTIIVQTTALVDVDRLLLASGQTE